MNNFEIRPESLAPGESDRTDINIIKKLFLLSYRFSQGAPSLQELIFLWLHRHYPSYILDASTTDAGSFIQPVLSYLHGKQNATTEVATKAYHEPAGNDISESRKAALDDFRRMKEIFQDNSVGILRYEDNGVQTINDHALVPKIAGEILRRDLYFFTESARSSGNPGMSQWCYYGLLANKTGSDEFNRLFAAVTKEIIGNLSHYPKAAEVVQGFNERNPDQSIDLSKYYRGWKELRYPSSTDME